MKQRVYLETSIISYLVARPSNDLRAMANQTTTAEWWESRKLEFKLYISELVEAEAEQGDAEAAERRLSIIADIPKLEITEEANRLALALVAKGPIPKGSQIDAYHIAVATVNGMDYLLTWNCKHIANARIRPKVEEVCRSCGYEPPTICTPLELMEG